jgi:hypothetical protein
MAQPSSGQAESQASYCTSTGPNGKCARARYSISMGGPCGWLRASLRSLTIGGWPGELSIATVAKRAGQLVICHSRKSRLAVRTNTSCFSRVMLASGNADFLLTVARVRTSANASLVPSSLPRAGGHDGFPLHDRKSDRRRSFMLVNLLLLNHKIKSMNGQRAERKKGHG